MNDNLKVQVRTLFHELDAEAPAAGPLPPLVDPWEARSDTYRPTLAIARAAVVGAVAVVTVAVWVARTNSNDESRQRVSSTPSIAAVTLPSPTVATPTTTSSPSREPAPSTQERLVEITSRVNSALLGLNSFSGSVTIHRSGLAGTTGQQATDSTVTNSVTLFGDGLMWVETEGGGWSSYDPASGTTRLAYLDSAGSFAFQQINGWTENATALSILVGHDPVTKISQFELGESPTVTERVFDGRPAWSLAGTPTTDGRQTIYIVDQQTGLTVQRTETTTTDEGIETVESSLTGITTNVPVPSAFPGTFPDGAVVDHSGGTLERLTIDDLASRFGPGFVAPADLGSSALLGIVDTPTQTDFYDTHQLTATIVLHDGFLRTTIEMVKHVFVAGTGSPQPEEAVVDGAICPSIDGRTCSAIGGDAPNGTTIENGIFAGHMIEPDSNYAFFQLGPTTYTISTPDPTVLVALVNSLSAYPAA